MERGSSPMERRSSPTVSSDETCSNDSIGGTPAGRDTTGTATIERDLTGRATVFAALGNADRLRVLDALSDAERCGCELRSALDAPQSTVSTHLRTLIDAGVVESDRAGKSKRYRIADPAVADLLDSADAIREVDRQ